MVLRDGGHGMVITISPSAADDAAALQAIYALCISGADWLPASAKQSPEFDKVSVGEMVYVARNEATQHVMGFVSVHVQDPFVHHLYVHPGSRGAGVGKLLLQSLESWLPKPWHLKCVRKNTAAMHFYARNGWREVGSGESADGAYAVLACG